MLFLKIAARESILGVWYPDSQQNKSLTFSTGISDCLLIISAEISRILSNRSWSKQSFV